MAGCDWKQGKANKMSTPAIIINICVWLAVVLLWTPLMLELGYRSRMREERRLDVRLGPDEKNDYEQTDPEA